MLSSYFAGDGIRHPLLGVHNATEPSPEGAPGVEDICVHTSKEPPVSGATLPAFAALLAPCLHETHAQGNERHQADVIDRPLICCVLTIDKEMHPL